MQIKIIKQEWNIVPVNTCLVDKSHGQEAPVAYRKAENPRSSHND